MQLNTGIKYSKKTAEVLGQCAEGILRDQDEMIRKEKQAALVQVATSLGHELRNSLGAIKNAAYFLRVAIEKPRQEVNEALEILEGQVSMSERIIHSLIWFARPRPPIRRRVNLNAIAEKALSHVPISGNILIVSQLDESLPAILADPDQLCQVFTNVILNAIQVKSEKGKGCDFIINLPIEKEESNYHGGECKHPDSR